MMRTADPEAVGDELLEAAIAFVTRAQGIRVDDRTMRKCTGSRRA